MRPVGCYSSAEAFDKIFRKYHFDLAEDSAVRKIFRKNKLMFAENHAER